MWVEVFVFPVSLSVGERKVGVDFALGEFDSIVAEEAERESLRYGVALPSWCESHVQHSIPVQAHCEGLGQYPVD